MSLLRQTLLFSALAYGQTAEVSTRDAPATFSSRVNLVLVPVVARDRAGKAIGTLHQEDFQLFDKGKLQVITKFSVEKAGAVTIGAVVATDENAAERPAGAPPPAPIAERFLIYFFDDLHLKTGDLIVIRNAADRHLQEAVGPTTRVAIFTTSGLNTLDFTDDREMLHKTMLRIKPETGAMSNVADCPDISYYIGDLILNKSDTQALSVATSEAMACLSLDPTMPSSQAIALAAAQSAASRAVSVGDSESQFAISRLKDAVRRLSAMPGSRSIILLSPGFYLTTSHRPEETDLMDRAIRSNVVISSLDARGLYTIIPGGDASTPNNVATPSMMSLNATYQAQAASAEGDVMAELADATGGTFFHNSNDLGEGFRRAASQPEFYYILGFSPQNLKLDGAFHNLKIAFKNPKDPAFKDVGLQARRGYYAPRHAADAEENAKEEIREALFSRDELLDIPVDLHMQFFKSSDVNAKLAVLARVDIRHIRFRKTEGRNKNVLTVTSGVFDRNGNFISGIQKIVDMNLKDQTLEALPESGITVRTNFDVMSGSYVVRLVVRDAEGQTMAARNGVVEIP